MNYYQNDYSPINTVSPSVSIPGQLGAEFKPLYNGNISSMAVNIDKFQSPLVYNYKYDQLNRLVQMDAWKSNNENWAVLTKQLNYHEGISYDANGNILRYQRNGDNSVKQVMDNMTYAYDYFTANGTRKTYDPSQPVPTDAARLTNRLNSIDDAIAGGDYPNDIDHQAINNYDYDEIGNLVKDVKEGITNINWTVYGKISSINKASGMINYTYDASGNRISKTVGGKTDWYIRDASGNVMSIYTVGDNNVNSGHITQNEIDIYGSSRLGVINAQKDLTLSNSSLNVFARGNKSYELANHLGNVVVTVSDKKIPIDNGTYDANGNKINNNLDGVIDYYIADVVSANDYYPFGMMIPDRTFSSNGYRYGFNGKERDKDITGESFDFGAKIYDVRIAKFLSVDPLQKKYPDLSAYIFSNNSPISNIDIEGKYGLFIHYMLTKYLLKAAGVSDVKAKLIAHCASVFADNPGGATSAKDPNSFSAKTKAILLTNIFSASSENPIFKDIDGKLDSKEAADELHYLPGIDYSRTKRSQSEDADAQTWHGTRTYAEKDRTTKEAAVNRSFSFAWTSLFKSASAGGVESMVANSEAIQDFSQAMHAFQDIWAHGGAVFRATFLNGKGYFSTRGNEHNIPNDSHPNQNNFLSAKFFSMNAIKVFLALSGELEKIPYAFEQGNISTYGMSKNQITVLSDKIQTKGYSVTQKGNQLQYHIK